MIEKMARRIYETERAKQAPPAPVMTDEMVEKTARKVFEVERPQAPGHRS